MAMTLRNVTRDVPLIHDPEMARSPWARFWGLMGRPSLPQGRGVVLEPSNSIHMFFMRFPIDAIFVDREWTVLHVAHGIKPWRISRIVRRSRRVIEVPAGTCRDTGTLPGDRLCLADA
jgi:uncharacterized membrane protein (UPF0127 family)